jgi:Spy/CpxP family protein refolding chaperone
MMTRLHTIFAVVLAAFLGMAVPVWAQSSGSGRESGSEGFSLLRVDRVQKDLKLTEEQKVQILALTMEARDPKTLGKRIGEILTPPQLRRLKQIRLQVEGPAAINSNEVAGNLSLTKEQRQKLKSLQDEVIAKMHEASLALKNLTADERRAKMPQILERMHDFRKEMMERTLDVLTPEQRTKLDKLQGQKLDLEADADRPSKPS